MARQSAGLLMYRWHEGSLQVLLAHPGGPFYRNKDEGVWTIPKGEPAVDEDPLAAAEREFREETGLTATGPFIPLSPLRLRSGKHVRAWAFQGDCNPHLIVSNTFTLEWPPRSGKQAEFPEVDRAAFFEMDAARRKIHPAQQPLLDELLGLLPRR